MNLTTTSRDGRKKRRRISRIVPASIQTANIVKGLGGMVPVVGVFVKGVAETAIVLLENLEQFQNNKEDIQDLTEDIIDIVIIVRDAGIQISAMPESIKYAAGLQMTCLKFQESFLCELSKEVNEISRKTGGVRRSIAKYLDHQNVKGGIARHRKLVENARANFLVQVTLNSSASLSRLNEQISSVQSILSQMMFILPNRLADNTRDILREEAQIMRHCRMPGGMDSLDNFQETTVRVQCSTDGHSVSTSTLIDCFYRLQHHFLFLWWCFHLRWSFSLRLDISPVPPSHCGFRTWAVIIGIDAYPGSPVRGCVADALAMEKYLVENINVPKGQIQLLTSSISHSNINSSFPNRENIIDALLSLSKNSNIHNGDNIIIYFAGRISSHLCLEYPPYNNSIRGNACIEALCPIDCVAPDNGVTGIPDISDREINTILNEICRTKGRQVTFILDCCHSRSHTTDVNILDGMRSTDPLPPTSIKAMFDAADLRMGWEIPAYRSISATDWLPNMEFRVVLAACREFDRAKEMERVSRYNGIFTEAFVHALKSGSLIEESMYIDVDRLLGLSDRKTPVIVGKHMNELLWYPESNKRNL